MKYLLGLRVVLPLIIALFALLSVAISYQTARTAIQQETVARVVEDTRNNLNLLQGAITQFFRLQQIEPIKQIVSSMASKPDLKSFVVVDDQGKILASTDFASLGQDWRSMSTKPDMDYVDRLSRSNGSEVWLDDAEQVLDAYSSLCGIMGASLRSQDCGFIFYRIDLAHHYRHALSTIWQGAKLQAQLTLLGAVVLVLFISILVTRRIRKLTWVMNRFAAGERDQRTQCWGQDEISWLGERVNALLDQVEADAEVLRDREKRLDTLFEIIVDAIILIDDKGIIQRANPATAKMFGYETSELPGNNVKMLMPPRDRKQHDGYLRAYLETGQKKIIGTSRELLGQRRDNSVFPVQLSVSELISKGERMFVGVLRDISEGKALERSLREANEQLAISAATDGLTGLANRRQFDESLREAVNRATRDHSPLALLICDVDYFKNFNDFYGHQAGDACLQLVAGALSAVFLRSGELVARYGGEEFVAILPDTDRHTAEAMAAKVIEAVRTLAVPHEQSDAADVVSLSLGISVYTPGSVHPPTIERFIDNADKGLYQAKAAGRNRYQYGEDTAS